jgi:c-di-GMP-binding flagellar brake protein YcgR
MPEAEPDILSKAIARNSGAVLSLPSEGKLQHHKSRFLNETPEGVWLESIPQERALIQSLIAAAKICAISFKSSNQRVSFTATVLKLEQEFRVNETTTLPAVLIARPAEVKAVQRRNNFRVRVPGDANLTVRLWRIPDHFYLTDKPPRTSELALTPRDLSVGGIGATLLPQDGEPPKIVIGERLRVSVKENGRAASEELIIDSRVRFIRPGENQSVYVGIQFLKLQEWIEGRQVNAELTRIVGELQLEEVRRSRVDVAA